MSQLRDTFTISLVLGGTVGKYERVKLSDANTCVQAGLADFGIGVAMQGGVSGDTIRVRLYKAPTVQVKVSEAVTAPAVLYSEASGKVQDTAASTSVPLGYALEDAAADGDVIEMLPMAAVGVAAN